MTKFHPGTILLLDTSAASRLSHPEVASALGELLDVGIVATCVTIDLEAGFSARTKDEVNKAFESRRELLLNLEIDERAANRARAYMQDLAVKGMHRAVGPIDLLTAAVAELNNAVVLHYDADFEHVAAVSALKQQWIVPRGSID